MKWMVAMLQDDSGLLDRKRVQELVVWDDTEVIKVKSKQGEVLIKLVRSDLFLTDFAKSDKQGR